MQRKLACFTLLVATITVCALGLWSARAQQPRTTTERTAGLEVAQVNPLERRVAGTVRERGTLESASTTEVRSTIQSTIVRMVRERSVVKKGDLLVELDDSGLNEQVLQQRISIETARAGVLQAEADRESLNREKKAAIVTSELRLKVAELALREFQGEGGRYATQLAAINGEIALSRKRLGLAGERFARLRKAAEVEPDARIGLEDTQVAMAEAKEAIRNAEAEKRLLEDFRHPRELATLELSVAECKFELVTQHSSFDSKIQQAQAKVIAKDAALKLEEARLKRLQEGLKACKIIAPRDGLVVYAAGPATRRASSPTIKAGAVVRERQVLMRVVDMSRLQLNVKVHETRIAKVRIGQSVVIRFDALPKRVFRGKVTKVSKVPEPVSWFANNVKEYSVIASIEQPTRDLKLGMTALAEIDVTTSRKK